MPLAEISVLVADERWSARDIADRVRRSAGPLLLVLSPEGFAALDPALRQAWFRDLKSLNRDRVLIIAVKEPSTLASARAEGWQTVASLKQLKLLLKGHASLSEAMRTFSPSFWRQQIRSQLQFVGLLSLPKIRIWMLLAASAVVFLFIFFKLLPSARIRIWPHLDSDTYTMNIFLVASGATLPVPAERVHTMPLTPLVVTADRTMSFDQISKNFTGSNAELVMKLINDSGERYSLRKGTRLANQAGVVFRLKEDAILAAHSQYSAVAVADPLDLYGEVVGERGNVPAGLKWELPGLPEKERNLVYGRNEKPGGGGTTSYATVLKREDIDVARKKLEQELLAVAKQMVGEQRVTRNNMHGEHLVQLNYDELTKVEYANFVLPDSFIGQNVRSVPIQGSIRYTVLLYDEGGVLDLMHAAIAKHVSDEKVVVESSISKENMNIHVIPPWDDDFKWVKVTVDLSYARRFLLHPLTPSGARFGKYIRDNVSGKSIEEAERIIKNMPEVSRIDISVWPPWVGSLPSLGSSIDITEESN